jgi:hypothetical protein
MNKICEAMGIVIRNGSESGRSTKAMKYDYDDMMLHYYMT